MYDEQMKSGFDFPESPVEINSQKIKFDYDENYFLLAGENYANTSLGIEQQLSDLAPIPLPKDVKSQFETMSDLIPIPQKIEAQSQIVSEPKKKGRGVSEKSYVLYERESEEKIEKI